MSRLRRRLFPIVFMAVAVGAPLHAQRKSNVLTVDEIEKAKLTASTAYDVVQMLRPRWFAKHELARLPGKPTEGLASVGVQIWINDHKAGEVDYLKTIPAERVQQMRYYSQNEAASRFGPMDDAAIEVTLKR